MDSPETLAALGTEDTGREQTKPSSVTYGWFRYVMKREERIGINRGLPTMKQNNTTQKNWKDEEHRSHQKPDVNPVPREGQVFPVFYMTPVMLYNQDELVTIIRKQKQIT